jgi:hypothetical protein
VTLGSVLLHNIYENASILWQGACNLCAAGALCRFSGLSECGMQVQGLVYSNRVLQACDLCAAGRPSKIT